MGKSDTPFEYHDTDCYIACVGNNGGTDNFGIRKGFKRSVNLEDYLFFARIGFLYIRSVYQIIDAGFKQVGYFVQNLYRYI